MSIHPQPTLLLFFIQDDAVCFGQLVTQLLLRVVVGGMRVWSVFQVVKCSILTAPQIDIIAPTSTIYYLSDALLGSLSLYVCVPSWSITIIISYQ